MKGELEVRAGCEAGRWLLEEAPLDKDVPPGQALDHPEVGETSLERGAGNVARSQQRRLGHCERGADARVRIDAPELLWGHGDHSAAGLGEAMRDLCSGAVRAT